MVWNSLIAWQHHFNYNFLISTHAFCVAGIELPAGEVFKCETCNITLYDKDRYEDHLNYHTGVTPFQCPLCDFATWGRVSLNSHTKKVHGLSRKLAQVRAAENEESGEEGFGESGEPSAEVGEQVESSVQE
jgi:uncharacterized C2H2 Zn-finger protein